MHPSDWARAGTHQQHSASQKARVGGEFGTLQAQEHDVFYAAAHWTSIARMLISLGMDDVIVDTLLSGPKLP